MNTFSDPTLIAGTVAAEDGTAAQAFVPMPFDPVIGAVLPPTMALAIAKRREEYIADLKRHDFNFEFSDDQGAWLRGLTQRNRLLFDAASIDPDFRLWNANCAPGHERRAS